MSYSPNYNFDIVNRTKEILEENFDYFKSKDKEVTFLINCLLGLIVTISEKEESNEKIFNSKIDDKFLELIPESVGFIDDQNINLDFSNYDLIQIHVIEQNIAVNVFHKDCLKKKKKSWFIKNLRNGIAHQNISPINENMQWSGVRIHNINYKKVKDFEIVFTVDELRKFAINLAELYLNQNQTASDVK